MLARGLRHRAPVLWLLVPYAGGVALGKACAGWGASTGWLGGAMLAIGAAWVLRRRRGAVVLASLALLCAGYARYQHARNRIPAWDTLPARALRVTIEVERLFNADPAKPSRVRGIGRIRASNDPGGELVGQRLAFTAQQRRGCLALPGAWVEGVLVIASLPEDPAAGSFEAYLASAGINFRASRGYLQRTVREPPPWETARQFLLEGCERSLARGLERHPDLVAVYHGMLLGQVSALRPEQTRLFSETGTLHLFSVSGLHIGVVALALHTVLGSLRLALRTRVLVLLPVLAAYVYLTGSSPAAVRAFGMVAILEIGRAWHRDVNALSALATTALLTLLWDPLSLFSISFQYSYLIVAALLLLGQPLAELAADRIQPWSRLPPLLWRPWHHASRWLAQEGSSALCLGLSATLVGELCTLHYFKLVTPGGLAANLLLIPASSLAIIAGMVALAFSAVGLGVVAPLFNASAGLVIQLLLAGLRPWHSVEGTFARASYSQPHWGVAGLLAVLAALLWGYHRHWHPWKWWLPVPFVLTGLLLVFAVKFA